MGPLDDAQWKLIEEIKDDLRRELKRKRERNRLINPLIQSIETGECLLCGESKTVILLRGELSACEDCLNISMNLLRVANPITKEKLQFILKLQDLLG